MANTYTMQKQAARNLVLSTKVQTTWGEYLADAYLTLRQRFNPSTVFTKEPARRSDQMAAGKGTEFATNTQVTAWDTKGTITSEADAELLGWMLAMLFGIDTATGSGAPYTHNFTIPLINATMPATTIYVEETADQKFEYCDMAASSLSLTVPERGAITAALDMVGTGRWKLYTLSTMPTTPALVAANYLMGSDVQVTINLPPVGFSGTSTSGSTTIASVSSIAGLAYGQFVTGSGVPSNTTILSASGTSVVLSNAAIASGTTTFSAVTSTPFVGRQHGLSIKIDRQAKPFQSSGEGLYSASVASGITKFSVDFTIAANETDDVNQWFETQEQLSITIATNPLNTYQMSFTFPLAYVKANKLTNTEDKVMWALSFDETSCVQSGSTPAIGAMAITNTPAYLVAV
jgi:hypothetical protein